MKAYFWQHMKVFVSMLLIFCNASLFAQLGGNSTYHFLNLHASARIAALGGSAINNPATDLNLSAANPALLNKNFSKQMAFSYVKYIADIGAGYVGTAYHSDSLQTTFSAGLQYIDYGNFKRMSPDGADLGNFTAGEYCFQLAATKNINSFQIGAQAKFIYSNLETYQSVGIATDLAAAWFDEKRLSMATLVISNLGTQLSTYSDKEKEKLPLNVQLGYSKKFEHSPLRIGVIAQHLEMAGKLLYQIENRNNNNIDLETGLPIQEDFSLLDQMMSHLILNGELVLTKNFNLRIGYNHLKRRELALTDSKGTSGYSWGFGIKINRFQLHYGSGAFLGGQNTNHFSIITNLEEFKKKN